MAVEYVGKVITSRNRGYILNIPLFIKKPPMLKTRHDLSSLVITAIVANTDFEVTNNK
jgi:hypothetical protein